jgi:hypothetical protein
MSLTHSLKFHSQRTAEEILNSLLSNNVGMKPAKYDQMKAEGLFGRVSEVEKLFGNYIQERYKTVVNFTVTFDEDSDGNIEEGEKIMGKTVALVLQQEKGDAIFFYVVDTPILRRSKGQIVVSEEKWYQWLRDGLDKAGLNYKTKPTKQILENRND